MDNAYEKIITSLKRRVNSAALGATAADVCADTALPLAVVRELLPKAADEYSAGLRVTESGEILYDFPHGFKSRYRGFSAFVKKTAKKCFSFLKKASSLFFKIWIMVMLIGYFIFFLALAAASVVISIAARSSNNNTSSDSGFGGLNLFGIMWHLWFYSEITRPSGDYGYERIKKPAKEKRPIHKAIFSFVLGDEDPNKNWEDQENKAFIAFLQANRGVCSLFEYMAYSGRNSTEAQEGILSFCSKYGGSPEVTEEGTIVYRFDELLLKSDNAGFSALSPPIQYLKTFSTNKKSKNIIFALINAVNLAFGSYFLFNSVSAGNLIAEAQYQASSYLYAFTHLIMDILGMANPQIFIMTVLGIVPLLFSVFFWLVPAVRFFLEKNENEKIKLKNFKRFGFSKIWFNPFKVDIEEIKHPSPVCNPKKPADDRLIKEIGAVSMPEIETGENGKLIYSFNELDAEKKALKKYRSLIDLSKMELGKTVFDSSK